MDSQLLFPFAVCIKNQDPISGILDCAFKTLELPPIFFILRIFPSRNC